MAETGRFAPSPTGPLHLGSLVAAVGSWLFARSRGGRWLVRIEDLDRPRVVAGSTDEILGALRRYGLDWDGEVVHQSRRVARYETALLDLRQSGVVFDCGCSRSELLLAASAPIGREPVYPGTCRSGVPSGRQPRSVRFRVGEQVIAFDDDIHGPVRELVGEVTGDFVLKRADGVFAYQLAVVVDDAEQEVTQVVRGSDLLDSTARQIVLQRALGFPQPRYAHLPLLLGPTGRKLAKRDGALPLVQLDEKRVAATLSYALGALAIDVEPDAPARMLDQALARFHPERIGREAISVAASGD